MPFRIDVPTPVRKSLLARFQSFPLREILEQIRDRLPSEFAQGRQAPLPYTAGVKLLELQLWTSDGLFRVAVLYEAHEEDQRLVLLDLGILGTPGNS